MIKVIAVHGVGKFDRHTVKQQISKLAKSSDFETEVIPFDWNILVGNPDEENGGFGIDFEWLLHTLKCLRALIFSPFIEEVPENSKSLFLRVGAKLLDFQTKTFFGLCHYSYRCVWPHSFLKHHSLF